MLKNLSELIEHGNLMLSYNWEYPNEKINYWAQQTEIRLRKEGIDSDTLMQFKNSPSFIEQMAILKSIYNSSKDSSLSVSIKTPSIINNNNVTPIINVNQNQVQSVNVMIDILNKINTVIENSSLTQLEQKDLKELIKEIEAESKQNKPRWESILDKIRKVLQFGIDIIPLIFRLIAVSNGG